MGDREALAFGDHFNFGELRPEVASETVGAQILGAPGNLREEQLTAPFVATGAVPGDVDLGTLFDMGDVVHLHESTSRLAQIETEVFETVDRMCLRVGALMFEARELDGPGFQAWVNERMPFGYDTARRLVAIYLAYRELPAESIAKLPRPWQAMFALRHWSGGRLEEALASGEIGPNTTVVEAQQRARAWSSQGQVGRVRPRYSTADLAAGKLLACDPDEVNPDVFRALSAWISRRAPDRT